MYVGYPESVWHNPRQASGLETIGNNLIVLPCAKRGREKSDRTPLRNKSIYLLFELQDWIFIFLSHTRHPIFFPHPPEKEKEEDKPSETIHSSIQPVSSGLEANMVIDKIKLTIGFVLIFSCLTTSLQPDNNIDSIIFIINDNNDRGWLVIIIFIIVTLTTSVIVMKYAQIIIMMMISLTIIIIIIVFYH